MATGIIAAMMNSGLAGNPYLPMAAHQSPAIGGRVLLFAPLSTRRSHHLPAGHKWRRRRRRTTAVFFVLGDAGVKPDETTKEDAGLKDDERRISTAKRVAERSARKWSERRTYLVAAVMSSLGITSMAVAAVYYRFAWQMEGGEMSMTEMFGTFALSVGAAVSSHPYLPTAAHQSPAIGGRVLLFAPLSTRRLHHLPAGHKWRRRRRSAAVFFVLGDAEVYPAVKAGN